MCPSFSWIPAFAGMTLPRNVYFFKIYIVGKNLDSQNMNNGSEKGLDYPLDQIYFYLTEGCNLACRHCWLDPKYQSGHSNYPVLPLELFESAIHEAKPLGLHGVKLTGGEPLMHPDFLLLLEIIRRENLSLNIETNGVLCTADIAAEIAKSPDRCVSVSIDGADADTHDRLRGVSGAFEGAQNAVRNLTNAGISPQIIMSLTRSNKGQIKDMVRMAGDLGASSLKINIVQPIARGKALYKTDESLNIGEMIRIGRYVQMELARTTDLKIIFHYPHAFHPLSSLAAGNGCGTCHIFSILGVIASGYYALCGIGNHVPELLFGRVDGNSLEAIWRGNHILNTLRSGLPEKLEGICSRCLMKTMCLGSCIALTYYRTGGLWAPFWFCEEAERRGLFPETRIGDKRNKNEITDKLKPGKGF